MESTHVKVLQLFDMPAVQYTSLAPIQERGEDNSSVNYQLRRDANVMMLEIKKGEIQAVSDILHVLYSMCQHALGEENKASSALRPPALKISAGILSIPNVLLDFMAEINIWRLIKSLNDRLLRDLLESRFFNCGRPLELCRAAYSPATSESFLVFDQVRSVRRQQGGAP
ncbi:unnamed protein product [Porites evermanni]|uniref:Uncharacterized protein n=1 Tax=Porites evermanni TaxID=104178 RepID=A0ABN8MKS7_9CNID|nr:unnamed protein product [Porites evermanni]